MTAERTPLIRAAAALLSSPRRFAAALRRVVAEWPRSCEQHLTNASANRVAWLGQAACCVAADVPEELTRLAWHTLPPHRQERANCVAANALNQWEDRRVETNTIVKKKPTAAVKVSGTGLSVASVKRPLAKPSTSKRRRICFVPGCRNVISDPEESFCEKDIARFVVLVERRKRA